MNTTLEELGAACLQSRNESMVGVFQVLHCVDTDRHREYRSVELPAKGSAPPQSPEQEELEVVIRLVTKADLRLRREPCGFQRCFRIRGTNAR